MAYVGDEARRCKICVNGKILYGRVVRIEVDEIFGHNTERNVHGELIADEIHKVSRYTIEVVE